MYFGMLPPPAGCDLLVGDRSDTRSMRADDGPGHVQDWTLQWTSHRARMLAVDSTSALIRVWIGKSFAGRWISIPGWSGSPRRAPFSKHLAGSWNECTEVTPSSGIPSAAM